MRKVIHSVLATVLIIGAIAVVGDSMESNKKTNSPIAQSSQSEDGGEVEPFLREIHQSVFIPYWNIISRSASEEEDFDSLIYFGVSYDATGKLIRDSGFVNIDSFIKNTSQGKERLLTVRMLDTDANLALLDDVDRQALIINQTLDLVEQYGFDGVVLDLEMGVIPLENVTNSITTFISDFARKARTSDLTFAITIYGDTFYRARPYDIKSLEPFIDRFLIMAYDFHKSRGEPGPNFPFGQPRGVQPLLSPLLTKEGNQRGGYNYSFHQMIVDFTSVIPPEQIVVLFGMYGYDWTLGTQGKPLKAAKAIPLKEIDPKGSIVDPLSKEKHILYTDSDGYQHELWYEDEESVSVKIEYLKKQGIGKVGYWVWGYF